MTARARRFVFGAAVVVAVACGRAERNFAGDSAAAQRLEGSWVLRLRVERLRLEPLRPNAEAAGTVSGHVVLVVNHWLDGASSGSAVSNYGSYDIDFEKIGFDPRVPGQPPRAEAILRKSDSVDVILEPEAAERVHLRGAWASDSLVGRWELEADRAGGDAAGSFVMNKPRPR